MVRERAGLSSASAGTVPGRSTSSRLSHAVEMLNEKSSTAVARVRIQLPRADVRFVFMFISLEAQTQAHDQTGSGRQHGLITRCSLPGGAHFRIPRDHCAIGNRNADRAVTRCVPAVFGGPQHRNVAHADAEGTAVGT